MSEIIFRRQGNPEQLMIVPDEIFLDTDMVRRHGSLGMDEVLDAVALVTLRAYPRFNAIEENGTAASAKMPLDLIMVVLCENKNVMTDNADAALPVLRPRFLIEFLRLFKERS